MANTWFWEKTWFGQAACWRENDVFWPKKVISIGFQTISLQTTYLMISADCWQIPDLRALLGLTIWPVRALWGLTIWVVRALWGLTIWSVRALWSWLYDHWRVTIWSMVALWGQTIWFTTLDYIVIVFQRLSDTLVISVHFFDQNGFLPEKSCRVHTFGE